MHRFASAFLYRVVNGNRNTGSATIKPATNSLLFVVWPDTPGLLSSLTPQDKPASHQRAWQTDRHTSSHTHDQNRTNLKPTTLTSSLLRDLR
jgi:hypothetical protein